MKALMLVLIGIIFIATVAQLRELRMRNGVLTEELARIIKKVDVLASENMNLEANIVYLEAPQNLVKEARAQLQYGMPGERLIVVVPKKQRD